MGMKESRKRLKSDDAVRFGVLSWRSSVASRVCYRRPSVAIETTAKWMSSRFLIALRSNDNGIFDKKIESMPDPLPGHRKQYYLHLVVNAPTAFFNSMMRALLVN